jgi:hypothetical protein
MRSRVVLKIIPHLMAWLALFGGFGAVYSSVATGQIEHSLLYNSDAFYLPTLLKNLQASLTLQGWDLPPSPYFFPDLLLYFLVAQLTDNLYVTMALFGVAQILLFLGGISLLQRAIFGASRQRHTLLLLSTTVFLLFLATGKETAFTYAILSAHHFGCLLVLPFALLLMLRVLQASTASIWSLPQFWGLLLLVGLTTFSDALFVIQFVVAALATMLLLHYVSKQPSPHTWWLSVGLGLAALGGPLLRQYLFGSQKLAEYTSLTGNEWRISLSELWAWASITAFQNPLLTLFWVSSFLTLLISLWLAYQHHGSSTAPVATLLFFVLSTLGTVAAVIVTGNFPNEFSTRYLLSALILPLIVGWPSLVIQLEPLRRQFIQPRGALVQGSLAGILLIVAQPFVQWRALATLPHFTDPFVACMDQATRERQLHNGLAHYWQAMYLSLLSQNDLHVVQVYPDLTPHLWNNNRDWYRGSFDFVITDVGPAPEYAIRTEPVLQRLGEPADQFECGNSLVLVYNRPTDLHVQECFAHQPRLARFDNIGDAVELYGCSLVSVIGGRNVGLSKAADERWRNPAGLLADATLPVLDAGTYALDIQLYSDSANTGAWTVGIYDPEPVAIVSPTPIIGAGKQSVQQTFVVPKDAKAYLQILYNGHGALFVDSMRLQRITPDASTPVEQAFWGQEIDDASKLRLLEPISASTVPADRIVDFVWEWTGGPLAPYQAFEVRLWHTSDAVHYGAHDAALSRTLVRQVGDVYTLRLDLQGAHSVMQRGRGDFFWSVAIVSIEPAYQDLQLESEAASLMLP